MKRRRLKFTAAALAMLLVCTGLEIGARAFWKSGPPVALPFNDDIFMRVADDGVYYALKPNQKFYYQGAAGYINSKGLRGEPLKTPKTKGLYRVAMIGDETVFGPGLRDADALPAQFEKALKKYSGKKNIEVINAGVPGYSIERSIAFMKHISKLEPDLALLVVSENDFDLQGVGIGGGRRPSAIGAGNQLSRGAFPALGRLMLPDGEARLRYSLANASSAYMMAALFFKGAHGEEPEGIPARLLNGKYAGMGGGVPADSSSCQSDRILWEPMTAGLAEIRALGEQKKFRFAGVLYSDERIKGRAALKLLESFEKAEVPLVNLASYQKPSDSGARTLKWLGSPNAAAHRESAAELVAALGELGIRGLPGAGARTTGGDGDYKRLAKARKGLYFEILNRQEVEEKVQTSEYRSALNFSSPSPGARGQILYGWWPPREMAWMGHPESAWATDYAAVVLSNPGDADTLHVEGAAYVPAVDAFGGTKVSFSFECSKPDTVYVANGDFFSADVPIPGDLTGRKLIEAGVLSTNPFAPEKAGGREGDDRLVSIGISLMELRKTGKIKALVK